MTFVCNVMLYLLFIDRCLCCDCGQLSKNAVQMLFWVLASFWVRSSKEALQDWSPRERKSVPFRGNFELRPLGVAMGNAVSVTRVWSIHAKTPPVGRRQPMTSLPARPQYKGAPGKYVILFFVFNDCFVWSVHSTGKNNFFTVTMASTSKAFRRCVHPCPRYLTPDDTHDLCVFCLGKEHARDVLEGAICVHWVFLDEKAPLSSVSLFEEGGAAVCFPQFRTHCCRGTEGNDLVGLAGGAGRWVREGAFPLALVGRKRGWAAGWWWCDFADIIWSSGWCSAGLCPGRAGDVWGWWSWGWARSILLPCVWRFTGGYGTRHGEAWLAVEAGQDGGAAGASWWALSFWPYPPSSSEPPISSRSPCGGWEGMEKAIFRSHLQVSA